VLDVHAAFVALVSVALLALAGCYPVDARTVPEATQVSGGTPIVTEPLVPGRLMGGIGISSLYPWVTPAAEGEDALRVEPVLTPWGEPWNHDQLIVNMDRILREHGVESRNARARMTAHAIVASGWRQSVFNHNAWGVKQGSWEGPWFLKSTNEVDYLGYDQVEYDTRWRSFESWGAAIDDYRERISRGSERPSYRRAARFLADRDNRADADFWRALSEGNYYTGSALTPERFGFICYRVRQTVPRD
jgi:hypothetical protein